MWAEVVAFPWAQGALGLSTDQDTACSDEALARARNHVAFDCGVLKCNGDSGDDGTISLGGIRDTGRSFDCTHVDIAGSSEVRRSITLIQSVRTENGCFDPSEFNRLIEVEANLPCTLEF